MSELDKLAERTEILFPSNLGFRRVEEFFGYLSKNSIEVSYNLLIKGLKTNRNPEFFKNERYASNISGTMTDFSEDGNFGMSSFSCIRDPEFMEDNFSGIRFQSIIDYELERHNPEEVKLWDKVKELTEKYFSNKRGCVFVL